MPPKKTPGGGNSHAATTADSEGERAPHGGTAAASSAAPPLTELFQLGPEAKDDQVKEIVNRHVAWALAQSPFATTHTVVLLHDPGAITRSDANRVYSCVANADRKKPILLAITSRGGDIAAAYFIAKVCRESTDQQFKVAVPREAKSAATLICCGADEIHMGSLSELGPIDPQFGNIPALALKHSVEHIAQLTAEYPAAKELFSEYLSRTLPIDALGYYERVAASAVQYAERLLNARLVAVDTPERRAAIAQQLVYAYKDHGFAIDSREATELFGTAVVKCNSDEYRLANQIYGSLDIAVWFAAKHLGRDLSFVGAADKGCWVLTRADSSQ
jgi:hypothetical protein